MPKKELTITQRIIGLIPTVIIVYLLMIYSKIKVEEKHFNIVGSYFGYIQEESEEPLLFKLDIDSDSIGNYFMLNGSKDRYYLDQNGKLELVLRNDITPYSYHEKEIKLKLKKFNPN